MASTSLLFAPIVDVLGGADGAIQPFTSKYSRNIAMTAVHAMGGATGLVNWAQSHPENEAAFWTKIFTRTIVKEVQIDDRRGIEDVLAELDIVEGQYRVVEPSQLAAAEPPIPEKTVVEDDEEGWE